MRCFYAILACVFLSIAGSAGAAVVQLGTPVSQYGASSTLASVTVPAGADRLLVVTASHAGAVDVSAVSFAGSPMIKAIELDDAGTAVDSIWYLALGSSASGTSGSVAVTFAGIVAAANEKFLSATVFAGVDQASPISSPLSEQTLSGTNLSASLNVVSAPGDLAFDLFDMFAPTAVPTAGLGAGQTLGVSGGGTISSGNFAGYRTSTEPGASLVTMSWTSTSTAMIHLAMNIKASVAVPGVSIAVAPADVAEDGATNLTYTVTRSANLASATVVNINVSGTATSGTDYTGGVATVVIPAGATSATFTIDPTVDGTVEADETVTMTVAAGTGYTVGVPSTATGTILNDDVPSATIAVAPASVSEDGAANLIYTVTLNQASFSALSINYTIGGTAANGTDYATIASPLVIPAGNTTGTITVDPTADATIEADETVILTLAAGAGYTVGVPNSATGTIFNDDLPNLVINDVTANEGNAGITNFTFTVSLSAPAGPGGVTFDIATANGSATAGVDYVASSLTGQTIPPGSSTYTFTVLVNGDTLNEPSETFFVNMTNVINAVVVDGQGVGTIVNDDPLPSLSINDVTVVEGNAGTVNAVFTVTLSAASGQTVSVNYATADGTATQPADYTNTSGTLTFTPGQTTQTITVPVIVETIPEANETFFVNLSGATNATIADNQGVGTITNDDVPVTVSPATLPNGSVAAAYSQTVTASGGVAPYSFAVSAGGLPTGLALSPAGALTGTPTAGGTFNFTVAATDSSPFPGPFSGSQAYTVTIAPPTIILPATALAGGTLGAPYSAAITPASGGTSPYAYAVTAGALPGGLALNASTGAITGTPGALGSFNFDVTATDSSTGTGPYTATQAHAITVIDVPPTAVNSSLTVAYNAPATNVPLSLGGGAATSLAITVPPTNGTAIVTGPNTITYQPTAGYAGPDSFTYTATNSGGTSAPATVTITVQDPVISITPSGGFAATVAAPYTQTFTFNGGAQPWSGYQVTNLPAGLSITGVTASTVTISGTPTEAGSFNLNVSATDSSTGNGPFTVGEALSLTVAPPTLTLAPAPTTFTPNYGAAFTQTFAAGGGTGPYSYTVTGTLPPGLSLTGDTLSGSPNSPGNYVVLITATDIGSTGTGAPFTIGQSYTFEVAAPTIVVAPATLPDPVLAVAYSQTITASGGEAPYTFTVTAGSLPAGITLSAEGSLSGTSFEVGTFNFTVTATDNFGQTGSRAYTVAIAAPTLTMTPAPGTLNAAYAALFSQAFTASGGSNTFSYAITGALPAGLNLSGDTISGAPTVPGSYPVTITATDTVLTGAGAPFSIAQNYTIDVPAPAIVVNPATLPDPTAAVAYSQTITASGGAATYVFAVTAGSLPPGITLASGGALSGTSNQVGSYSFTVTATDDFGQTGSQAYTFTIAAPALTLAPVAGTFSAPYNTAFSQTFTASGGSASFTYALSGALPTGVGFTAGVLSGTPTEPGSYPITVTATDGLLTGVGAPFSVSENYTIDVGAATITATPLVLASGTVGVGYADGLTASGGADPYAFALASGNLPAGVVLNADGSLSGNPTEAGTFALTVDITDANSQAGTSAHSLMIGPPVLVLTPAAGTLVATYDVAFTQNFSVSGGVGPYVYSLTGALSAGLSLSGGTLSGTPTQSGSFPISLTATDTGASGVGAPFTVTRDYTLVVGAPSITLSPAALAGGTVGLAYAQTLSATGGVGPYVFALASGVLPPGLALAADGGLSGTPTANGSYAFSILATDANGETGVANFSIEVAALQLTLGPAVLPSGTVGGDYLQNLQPGGGVPPYQFVISSGALPPGMSLAADGTLSGTPSQHGVYSFTVTLNDSASPAASVSVSYQLTVSLAALPSPAVIPTLDVYGLLLMLLMMTLFGVVALQRTRG